jgi:hypothetical protein
MKKEALAIRTLIFSLSFILLFHCSFGQHIFGNGLFTTIGSYETLKTIKTFNNEWLILVGIPRGVPLKGLLLKFNQAGLLTDSISFYVDSADSGYKWHDLYQTSDNGFLLTALGGTYDHFALAKLDESLNLQWLNKYYISSFLYHNQFQVTQLKDNSYIFSSGLFRNNPNIPSGIGICKIDSAGNLLWEKSICDTVSTTMYHEFITKQSLSTDDYGFIVSGRYKNWNEYLFISKYDSSGSLQWFKLYGDTSLGANHVMYPSGLVNCNSGGFYMVGNKPWRPLHDGFCPFIIKIDAIGTLEWAKYFNDSGGPFQPTIRETMDNNLLYTYGDDVVTIIKANNLGDSLWTRHYRGCREGSTYELGDSLVLVTNFYYYPDNSVISLIKLDSTGYFNCNEIIRPNIIQDISTIKTTNLYCIVDYDSTATTSGNLVYDTTTINLNYIDYCLYTHVENVGSKNSCLVYPNPSEGNFMITFPHFIDHGQVEICNLFGENFFKEDIYASIKKEINLRNISQGVYFIKVFDGEKSYCKKLIINQN